MVAYPFFVKKGHFFVKKSDFFLKNGDQKFQKRVFFVFFVFLKKLAA